VEYLSHFEHGWPVRDMIATFLRNHTSRRRKDAKDEYEASHNDKKNAGPAKIQRGMHSEDENDSDLSDGSSGIDKIENDDGGNSGESEVDVDSTRLPKKRSRMDGKVRTDFIITLILMLAQCPIDSKPSLMMILARVR